MPLRCVTTQEPVNLLRRSTMNINSSTRIPLPFSACTELHEELLDYPLPPAAQKMYRWLIRRSKPGTIQEFDKADFDTYCISKGRKPFSNHWFNTCLKKLISTRLIEVIRKYQGYGFKIRAYHPWQLDEWLLEDYKSNKNCDYSNKNCDYSNKNFKKAASNADSTVPSSKYNREKQSKDYSQEPVKETVAAAPKKNSGEKCDFSQGKSEEQGFTPQPKVKDQEGDLNASKSNNQQVNQKKKNPPRVDEKINNKKWRSHLKQLDDLGVRENDTIRKAVKKYSTKRVEDTIALYQQRKREGYVENPNAYFMQALIENWAEENVKQKLDNSIDPEDKAALFRYWYDLAKELGYCSGVEEREGDQWVLLSGTWEKFTDAWERGFNLEYLRKTKKRHEER